MSKNICVRATALTTVSGRVAYISSPEEQENLVAFYSTVNDPAFWSALASHSQKQAAYNPDAPVCEARELMVVLPNVLSAKGRYELCRDIVEDFHRLYGVECCGALHNNPGNFHLHLIFSERTLLPEVDASIATRNTYFNAEGKRSTKKECVDENGELLPNCRLVRKGESLSEKRFSAKDNRFAQPSWLDAEKHRFATFLNERVAQAGLVSEELVVYDKEKSVELPMTRIVKGEPAEVSAEKRALNAEKKEYNANVHEAIEVGVLSIPEALEQKKKLLKQMKPAHKEKASTEYVVAVLQQMRRAVYVVTERMKERIKEILRPLDTVDALLKNAFSRSGNGAGRADPPQRYQEKVDIGD